MKKLRHVLTHDLVHNTLALYGVQACRKAVPLITIPYLARILHADGWGTVAFVASLGDVMMMAIEYGFNLSATRELSQNRNSPTRCGEIAVGVFTAQVCLALAVTLVLLLCRPLLPVVGQNPDLFWAGLFYGIAQGFNPLWFFQGFENLKLAALIEVAGKLLGLACLFLFIHGPADAWKALILQALPALCSTIVGIYLSLRYIRLCRPTFALTRRALRNSLSMFLFRSGESLYGAGNSFILGFFASTTVVGYFSMAERICRALMGLLDPIREAVFPRLSHLVKLERFRAAKLAGIGSACMIGFGVLLGGGIYLFAPVLVHLAGAQSFTPAIDVLRIFALLPPIASITYSVGVQWLLSLGRESVVNRVMLLAGALNISLAFAFATRFQHFGMAWSVIITESFVCACLIWAVNRSAPWWRLANDMESTGENLTTKFPMTPSLL